MLIDTRDIADHLPPEIETFLENNDYLGFDDHEQAVHAILTHNDFLERWDCITGNTHESVATIWDWKQRMAKQFKIKQVN